MSDYEDFGNDSADYDLNDSHYDDADQQDSIKNSAYSDYDSYHSTRFSSSQPQPLTPPAPGRTPSRLPLIPEENSNSHHDAGRHKENEALNESANTWGSGLASSFSEVARQQRERNYSEEFANGNNALKIIEKAQESFNNSGRRLQLPDDYEISHHSVQNTSWENDIAENKNRRNPFEAQGMTKLSLPVELPSTPKSHISRAAKGALRAGETRKPRHNIPVEFPSTPTAVSSVVESQTPQRCRQRRPALVSSTPLAHSRESLVEFPSFGNLSEINATMNDTMETTSGMTEMEKILKNIDLKASSDEILSTLEKYRKESAVKKRERESARMELIRMTSHGLPLKPKQPETSHDYKECIPKVEAPKTMPPDSSLTPSSSRRSSITTAREPTAQSGTRLSISGGSRGDERLSQQYIPKLQSHKPLLTDSSFPTNRNSNGSTGNTESLSSSSSRRSSIITVRECGSPLRTPVLSNGSTSSSAYSSDDSNSVTIDRSTLPFSLVELGGTFIDSVRICNRGQGPIKLTLGLRRENSGYKILDASTRVLEAGQDMDIRVEFRPVELQRHNNTLYIATNLGQKFQIKLRGIGGIPSVSIETAREQIRKTSSGKYLMQPIQDDGHLQLKLRSTGQRRAFCKIFVFADDRAADCTTSPTNAFLLKPGVDQTIKIRNIKEYLSSRRSSMNTSADGKETSRLKICVYWGDEIQRQRARAFLKQSGRTFSDSMLQDIVDTKFSDEKPFVEPKDYLLSSEDVKQFEIGVNITEISVLPLTARSPSNDFDKDWASQTNVIEENTFVRDYDETIMSSR